MVTYYFQFWSFSSRHCSFHRVSARQMGYPENSSRLKTERRNAWISRREGGKRPFYQIEHIPVLKRWRICGSWVREIVSASKSQLSLLAIPISPTVDSRLFPDILRQAYNSLFGKISCILVNWGMWERRREGNDVQISDFMHSREMGAGVGERGNDVQVGAALIPFLVNTSLLILTDWRSNHKWDTARRNSSSESHQRQQMADKRRADQNWSESNG